MPDTETKIEDAVCWEKCDMCGDFICNIHGGTQHVADCPCPPIDDWPSTIYPYDATVGELKEAMKTHPHCPGCGGPTGAEGDLCGICFEVDREEDYEKFWGDEVDDE